MADRACSSGVLISFFHKNGRVVRYSKGEIVCDSDQDDNNIYLIEKGRIKIYTINNEGDKFLHIIYRAGELFPLDRVVRNMRHQTFYEAQDQAILWKVTARQFNDFVNSGISEATGVLRQVLEQFAVYRDRVNNLEYKHTSERLAYHLLFLAYRFGQRTNHSITLDASFTQQDIANSINMARESASREFERLERSGAVELIKHKIVIKDVSYLSELVGESFDPEVWSL